jgi:hypothetical protein
MAVTAAIAATAVTVATVATAATAVTAAAAVTVATAAVERAHRAMDLTVAEAVVATAAVMVVAMAVEMAVEMVAATAAVTNATTRDHKGKDTAPTAAASFPHHPKPGSPSTPASNMRSGLTDDRQLSTVDHQLFRITYKNACGRRTFMPAKCHDGFRYDQFSSKRLINHAWK